MIFLIYKKASQNSGIENRQNYEIVWAASLCGVVIVKNPGIQSKDGSFDSADDEDFVDQLKKPNNC